MSIIVTGAAGFIGSNLLQALNRRGETDIIAVDDLTDGEQFRNLADADIADYLTRTTSSSVTPAATSARSARCSTRVPAPAPWKAMAAT